MVVEDMSSYWSTLELIAIILGCEYVNVCINIPSLVIQFWSDKVHV